MRKKYLAFLVCLSFFIGCASNIEQVNKQENSVSIKENQILNIEKISINGKIYNIQNAESKPNITFSTDKFYGSSGCNRFFGTYQKNSNLLSIGEQSVASTQMLCYPADVMEFERLFLTNLRGSFKILNQDGKLILDNDTMKIFFE